MDSGIRVRVNHTKTMAHNSKCCRIQILCLMHHSRFVWTSPGKTKLLVFCVRKGNKCRYFCLLRKNCMIELKTFTQHILIHSKYGLYHSLKPWNMTRVVGPLPLHERRGDAMQSGACVSLKWIFIFVMNLTRLLSCRSCLKTKNNKNPPNHYLKTSKFKLITQNGYIKQFVDHKLHYVDRISNIHACESITTTTWQNSARATVKIRLRNTKKTIQRTSYLPQGSNTSRKKNNELLMKHIFKTSHSNKISLQYFEGLL